MTSKRKQKKKLGRTYTKAALYRKYQNLIIKRSPKTIHDDYDIKGGELFCPRCGCEYMYHADHYVPYPEMWVSFYCARCEYEVGSIDNSPFIHAIAKLKSEEIYRKRLFTKSDYFRKVGTW
jgi:hypothetical protein